MTDIRKSPSGARETIASGGGAFAPIGQARWLDAASVLTPDGSIRAPLLTYSPFWAELVGKSGSWQLNLPGAAPAVDGSIPNLVTAPSVVIQGQSDARTTLNALAIAQQASACVFEFRDVKVTALSFPAGMGSGEVRGRDATFTAITSAGTLAATVTLINCRLGTAALGDCDLQMFGGAITGDVELNSGALNGASLAPGKSITIGSSCTFLDFTFGAASKLFVDSNQTLTMDGPSWGSMLDAGVLFPDTVPTLVILPYLPVMGEVTGPASTVVNGSTSVVLSCGMPTPYEPEPICRCVAQFKPGSPSHPDFIVVAAEIVGQSVQITVRNTSALTTHTLSLPKFHLVYEPRLSPP